MATKNETAGALIDSIKADLRTTTTCSNATLAALQRLLLQKNQETEQKENVRVKVQATARRRAGTTTAAATVNVVTKQTVNTLAPREKYILATEVANTTLKTLADVLKNPSVAPVSRPSSKAKSSSSEDARKPTRPRTGHAKGPLVSQRPLMERSASQTHNSPQKRVPRRSSSYSSFSSAGPEAGLVATAECARIAFGYLGTPEAMKVLGKDSQALQYENGVIVLIGKLVALGLDVLAIKELRTLKRRLDKYCTKDSEQQESGAHNGTSTEKESLASLLDFRTIDPKSPALPLIATFQTYALRIIAKLRRPQIIESAWEFLKLSNPSSVANLIWHTAQTPTGQAKTARQLESLAQTILALCPSVSSADDVNQSHPSPGIVLQLQQLAFKIRKRWWTLAKHQGNEEQELLEPFAKCIIAFARRSQLTSTVKYRLAESLCSDLRGQRCDTDAPSPTGSESTTTLNKALCSLAQAAGLSEEALRLLGPAGSTSNSNAPTAKNTSRLVRIATVSLEACLKGEKETDLEVAVADVITSLKGGLGGTAADLESLFVEVNGLRRAATKLLLTAFPSPASEDERSCREQQARSMIAASVHFSARFLGTQLSPEADSKAHERHRQRIATMWKYSKSIVDSILACCKQNVRTQEQWTDIGSLLQESSHIIHRLKEEVESGTKSDTEHLDLLSSHTVKLSNACWAVYLQLRKARLSPECLIEAMEHSVQLLKSSSHYEAEAGHLPMKLEQLGEALENVDRGEPSRKVFEQCIESHLNPKTTRLLADLASKSSLHKTFSCDGLLNVLGRVLKAYHRSFLKFGIKNTEELAFYDDLALEPEIRGSLLEWQLGFFLRTLSRNRQWDSKLDRSIRTLVIRLSELYTPDVFPIRHLRLSSMRLQLAQHDQHCVPEDMMPLQFSQASKTNQTSTKDQGLLRFEGHLQALHNLRSCMQQPYFATKTFRQCFTIWETLLNAASSWDVLVDHIDDIEDWLKEIQVSVEFLNAKGEEYFAIGVLRLLVRILELQNKSDPTDLVTALCALGLQFLRLGYTGKAGLSLAKAESLIKSKAVSTEATLQWHISYAEYLLTIGNNTKW
jgi:separase